MKCSLCVMHLTPLSHNLFMISDYFWRRRIGITVALSCMSPLLYRYHFSIINFQKGKNQLDCLWERKWDFRATVSQNNSTWVCRHFCRLLWMVSALRNSFPSQSPVVTMKRTVDSHKKITEPKLSQDFDEGQFRSTDSSRGGSEKVKDQILFLPTGIVHHVCGWRLYILF